MSLKSCRQAEEGFLPKLNRDPENSKQAFVPKVNYLFVEFHGA